MNLRVIILFIWQNKDADQLRGYRAADLHLCFRIYAKSRFSHDAAHIILEIYKYSECIQFFFLYIKLHPFLKNHEQLKIVHDLLDKSL